MASPPNGTAHQPHFHRNAAWKQPVRVATTTAGALASSFDAGSTVDGETLAEGDRILVKDQADETENGIYRVEASGAPTRAFDMDAGGEFVGAVVLVLEGSQAATLWHCTVLAEVLIGTDDVTFAQLVTGTTVDPAATVESETTWAITPAVGSDTEYARQDHTHGAPANPVTGAALEALGVRGELLVADGTTGPNGIVPTSYVEEEDAHTTTSATLEDIPDVTTTITLQRASHVAAWLNTQISGSGSCVIGVAVNFNGTDHDEMQHAISGSDAAALAVVHRTATELPPGTYTIKGRMRRVSGASTPSVDRADMLVMALGASGPVLLTNEDEDDYLYANLA